MQSWAWSRHDLSMQSLLVGLCEVRADDGADDRRRQPITAPPHAVERRVYGLPLHAGANLLGRWRPAVLLDVLGDEDDDLIPGRRLNARKMPRLAGRTHGGGGGLRRGCRRCLRDPDASEVIYHTRLVSC